MKVKELFLEQSEDLLAKAKKYVSDKYSEMAMASELDDEIPNWVDNWEEDDDGAYNDEYEWYDNYGRGEAEEQVISNIITDIEGKFGKKFTGDEEVKFSKWMQSKYTVLRH